MRLFDVLGRSKGAVNLVRVSVAEELVEECRVDSFICVLYGVDGGRGQLLRMIALSKSVRDAKCHLCQQLIQLFGLTE